MTAEAPTETQEPPTQGKRGRRRTGASSSIQPKAVEADLTPPQAKTPTNMPKRMERKRRK